MMLQISNISVQIDGKFILRNFSLEVRAGEIHAIMGPNGAGKSTLAKVLGGHPSYEAVGGSVTFRGKDLLSLEPEERAANGLFMSFQYPVEIPGVSNAILLQTACNAQRAARSEVALTDEAFQELLAEKMRMLQMDERFCERNVNEGFSGGEKKRNEILQMAVLEPSLAVLDETDSGLDIDALRDVAAGINCYMNGERALILITHYQRLLDYVQPTHVHVLAGGRLVHSGGPELALKLESEGYDWVTRSCK